MTSPGMHLGREPEAVGEAGLKLPSLWGWSRAGAAGPCGHSVAPVAGQHEGLWGQPETCVGLPRLIRALRGCRVAERPQDLGASVACSGDRVRSHLLSGQS